MTREKSVDQVLADHQRQSGIVGVVLLLVVVLAVAGFAAAVALGWIL